MRSRWWIKRIGYIISTPVAIILIIWGIPGMIEDLVTWQGWIVNVWNWLTQTPTLLSLALIIIGILILVRPQRFFGKRRNIRQTTNKVGENQPQESTYPIRDWIDISAWTVHKQEIPNSLAYKIVLDDAPIFIIRQENKPEVVNLLSPLSLTSPQLSKGDLERLSGQIRRELSQLHIQHRFSTSLDNLEIVHYVILDKDVTEYTFRDKIMDVIRARISVVELWKEAIRQSEKSILDKGDSQTQ